MSLSTIGWLSIAGWILGMVLGAVSVSCYWRDRRRPW